MTLKMYRIRTEHQAALEAARIHFNRTKELFLCGIAAMDELIAAKDALTELELSK